MRIHNIFYSNPLDIYSDYYDFQFTDGTFNITIALNIRQFIFPTECGLEETIYNGILILEYNCLIEFKFIGLHDPSNELMKNLIYITLTINAEDESLLSLGALPITDEISLPASCRYQDSIKIQSTLCMPNDCTQEKDSTALIYGQNFQFLIHLLDPSLTDAFQLDHMQIFFKFPNQIVNITHQCTKLCNHDAHPANLVILSSNAQW